MGVESPAKANGLKTAIDTIIAPKEAFEAIRNAPTWFWALAISIVITMIGGYLSFQGINGAARFRGTAVEEVLPVHIHAYDDRIEVPEGFRPVVSATAADHPLLAGIPAEWPVLLGLNEVVAKAEATVLAHAPEDEGAHPLLVTGHFGRGRTLAWTTDIGPHWLPQAALDWPGFTRLWSSLLTWLCG